MSIGGRAQPFQCPLPETPRIYIPLALFAITCRVVMTTLDENSGSDRTPTLSLLRERWAVSTQPSYIPFDYRAGSGTGFLYRAGPYPSSCVRPLVRRQGIRQSFFGKITLKKTSSPHECKPSCVNPTPFLPTTHRRLWIHIRKSLNAGTSKKKTEPLARKKVLGSRTECFQSLTVVLQPSHSCSVTSFKGECKSSNGSPKPGVHPCCHNVVSRFSLANCPQLFLQDEVQVKLTCVLFGAAPTA